MAPLITGILKPTAVVLAIAAVVVPGATAATSGEVDATFAPSVTDGFATTVSSIAIQPDGKIVIAGDFTKVGGVTRNRIARVGTDGALDSGFAPSVGGATTKINAVALQADGNIVLGGSFTEVGVTGRQRIARVTASGDLDTAFNPGATQSVYRIRVQSDGKILLAGWLGLVASVARPRLARVLQDGSLDTAFFPNPNADVRDLAIQPDGKIVIGGDFRFIGGDEANRLARLTPDGVLDTSFAPSVTDPDPGAVGPNGGIVFAVLVQPDGKIVIGGDFSRVNGVARSNLARLNADGTLDVGFDAEVDDRVESLALQSDGEILIGGGFQTVDGVTRNRLARLNADGSLDTSFNPNVNANTVETMVIQPDGRILIGGGFTQVGGVSRNRVARVHGAPPMVAPSGVTAVVGDGQAAVTWSGVDGAISSYSVTSDPGGRTCTAVAPATSCTVTGLTNDVVYSFAVTANNEFGQGPSSSPSPTVTPKRVPASAITTTQTGGPASLLGSRNPTKRTPGQASGVKARAGGAGSAIVTWKAPKGGIAVTRYTVTASPGGRTCVWSKGPLRCVIKGLRTGTRYTFVVRATGAGGSGLPSAASKPFVAG